MSYMWKQRLMVIMKPEVEASVLTKLFVSSLLASYTLHQLATISHYILCSPYHFKCDPLSSKIPFGHLIRKLHNILALCSFSKHIFVPNFWSCISIEHFWRMFLEKIKTIQEVSESAFYSKMTLVGPRLKRGKCIYGKEWNIE